MVLICISGEMGIGKTLSLTYLAWRKYLKGLDIFSNYHLKFPPYPNGMKSPVVMYIKTINDVLAMRSGYACLDELWASADCLSGDSLIPSLENVNYFSSGCESFLSANFKNCKIEPTENTASAMRKIKTNEKLVKISTKTREITCSDNHVFFSITRDTNLWNRKKITENNLNEFIREKRASELRKGDRVITAFKLPSPKEEKIDMKTAQLLGYIMGDGTIEYPHRCAIHIDDQNLKCLKKYGKMASELGFSTSYMKLRDVNCWRLRIFGKRKIQELLAKIRDATIEGKYSTFLEDIPKVITESNNKILGAFIRGFYDAEGCIVKEKVPSGMEYIRINLPQKHRLVLDKIKSLLLRFGIDAGRIKLQREKERFPIFMFNIKDSVSIGLFKKYIGFTHPEKKIRLQNYECKDCRNPSYKRINFANRTKRKIMGDLEIGFITKVERIEKPSDEKLYDVTIPKYENYIANGFIVHNSRLSGSKKNKFVSQILLKSRKRDIHIGYTCQSFHQIDKRIRDVTDFIAEPRLNTTETICRLTIRTLPSREVMKIYRFPTAPIFTMFNTHEEVGSIFGDDDESKLREITKEHETSKNEFLDDEPSGSDDDVMDGAEEEDFDDKADTIEPSEETEEKKEEKIKNDEDILD